MFRPPSLPDLLTGLSARDSTAAALTEEAIQAAERLSSLNAFIRVHTQEARQKAASLDQALESSQPPGALHGLPVAIKDNIDQAGTVCSAACKAYRDRKPERDAEVVRRLEAAGAVLVGRTNMHELADGVTSEDSPYGPVHNPWRSGLHPGGSSGGSAAAVAAGIVVAALGTDTGGSVRIPASLCGVVGFKPTTGLVPTEGVMPLSTTLDHVGPIARTVRGAATLLEVLAGPLGGGMRAACDRGVVGLKVGLLAGFGLHPDPGMGLLFEQVSARLAELGCSLTPVRIPSLEGAIGILASIYPPEAAAWHAEALAQRPEEFGHAVRADLQRGRDMPIEKKTAALERKAALTLEVDRAMENVDLLVCPTTPHPARRFGSPDSHTYLTYTCPFNLTGQPAISVPMGLNSGLPCGLQVIGHRDDEYSVLRLAAAFEAATGFVCEPKTRTWE